MFLLCVVGRLVGVGKAILGKHECNTVAHPNNANSEDVLKVCFRWQQV